jgi:hypothetical protein
MDKHDYWLAVQKIVYIMLAVLFLVCLLDNPGIGRKIFLSTAFVGTMFLLCSDLVKEHEGDGHK